MWSIIMNIPAFQTLQTVQSVRASKKADAAMLVEKNAKHKITSVAQANRLMESKLYEKLEKAILEAGGGRIKTLDPDEFTPEAVADRILGFVGNAVELARGQHGDIKAEQMLEQARKGIEQGFSDAKNILDGLGVFNGQIESNANATYDLLQKGLQALGENTTATKAENTVENRLALAIETAEGDQIEIQISSTKETDINANKSGFSYSSSQTQAFTVEVNGDINEQEANAIRLLLNEASTLSDAFFSGDTHLAFTKAMELGYDASSIASFAFTMQENKTSKVTEAYASVQRIADTGYSKGMRNSIIPTIRQFMEQLGSSVENLKNSQLFAKPETALVDSFSAISFADERKRGLANALEHRSDESLKRFGEHLVDVMNSQHHIK